MSLASSSLPNVTMTQAADFRNFDHLAKSRRLDRAAERRICDEKRVAHRQGYGLTNGRKLCVFRLDGVFGTDRSKGNRIRTTTAGSQDS